ncbi:rhomboid family protein [Altibacter sp. HG106]|uniref:rhomboid family protein n=1 Tax=Altibacter sp. HG106 TaxID=3023937 RepID=UPI0023502FF6|nr:rhomboid family intramembrane serine protease [Altibacter sp. HG106]MDC7995546.1 rhomboid family intramembrane serine protease [Altibacter sp. HG106]
MSTNNLTYKFKRADITIKLIVINAIIFLVSRIISAFFRIPIAELMGWFVLPDAFGEFILQPWAFITYSFLHFDFFHILFNMLLLYYFGRIILNLFSEKRLLTIYFLGAISGGVLFVLSYNLFPLFDFQRGYLLGASGAVTALLVFMATYSPNTEVRVFFFTVKLWHIAVFFILMDLVRLPTSGNAGGLLAHIGGAIFGYFYAVQMAKGNDIGAWFETLMDGVANLFKTRKQRPFKTVHRNQASKKKAKGFPEKENKSTHQKKVDAILDKISKSGYDSLTKAEKDFLFQAGKEE